MNTGRVAMPTRTKGERRMTGPHLLFHLLDFSDEASPRLAVVVTQQVDVEVSGLAELLLLLLLGVLQLALCADALGVVHVVRLHHLTDRDGNR